MLTRALEQTLHRAIQAAAQRRHEYATLEHLLLGLVDDADAALVLRACTVDLDRLANEVTAFLDVDLAGLVTGRPGAPKPTAGFQRVVQQAATQVQSAGGEEVTGANVLVALFGEHQSHAVYFLQSQGMTRLNAVNFVLHGIAKETEPAGEPAQVVPDGGHAEERSVGPAAITAGLRSARDGFDTLRMVLGLVKEIEGALPPGEKKDAVAVSLAEAEKQIRTAEAQITHGFGAIRDNC